MKIFHVAPYGPNSCRTYEAHRDMMRADALFGHEVYFIDKGYIKDSRQEYHPIGTIDDRWGFKVIASNLITLNNTVRAVKEFISSNQE